MALKIKRGHGAPTELLKEGEPYLDLDSGDIYYGTGVVNLRYVKHNGTKIYRALLYQSGTNAPVPTILENTIGDIVWTRLGVGSYRGTLTGAFPQDKTICLPSLWFFDDGGEPRIAEFRRQTDDYIQWAQPDGYYEMSDFSNMREDGKFYIEIIVYP